MQRHLEKKIIRKIMGKVSQKYVQNGAADKFFNEFGSSKSINWLYFDAVHKIVLGVALGLHYL